MYYVYIDNCLIVFSEIFEKDSIFVNEMLPYSHWWYSSDDWYYF